MSKPQRIAAGVTLFLVSAVLFWSFAGSQIVSGYQHPQATGLFSDLNPSPFDIGLIDSILGYVLPLLVAGAGAVVLIGGRAQPETATRPD